MDDNKRDAYLHLMYRAFVEIRLFSAIFYKIKSSWWNPFEWRRIYKYYKQINRLSDAFHNLPLYLKSDNKTFDEESFWRYLECYEKQYVNKNVDTYWSIFEKVMDGEKRNII